MNSAAAIWQISSHAVPPVVSVSNATTRPRFARAAMRGSVLALILIIVRTPLILPNSRENEKNSGVAGNSQFSRDFRGGVW